MTELKETRSDDEEHDYVVIVGYDGYPAFDEFFFKVNADGLQMAKECARKWCDKGENRYAVITERLVIEHLTIKS